MGVEILTAVGLTTAAATSVGLGIANYEAGQDAAAAQKSLANAQAAKLKEEQDAATAQAAEQAKTGLSFGFGDNPSRTLLTGFGFGSAPDVSANSGRGQITGLG